jgi:DNA helicase-2/ATP-dependent DNA helicase PcrA
MPMHMQDNKSGSDSKDDKHPFRDQSFLNKYKNQTPTPTRKALPRQQAPVGIPKNLKKVTPSSGGGGNYANAKDIIAGAQVRHERFGKGKVLNIEDGKATVFFPSSGQKQLLLKFAKLEIVKP